MTSWAGAWGFLAAPRPKTIAFDGQASVQVPQEKQSGITVLFRRMAPMTSVGQALSQAPQLVQAFSSTRIRFRLKRSSVSIHPLVFMMVDRRIDSRPRIHDGG